MSNGSIGSRALFDDACSGRLSHAVLIEGLDRQERMSAAARLAKILVCSGEAKPCGVCADCVKAEAGAHPDIIEISGGETARSFSVDKVREVKSTAYIMPNEADRKVFILGNAGSMSEQAQNALLKILEEPPEFVSFILECGSKDVMLPTVLSRATVYTLGEESARTASEEKIRAAGEAAEKLAAALCTRSETEVLKATSVFEKDKELFRLMLPEAVDLFRSALVSKYGQATENESAKRMSERFSAAKLMDMIKIINGCFEAVGRNANHNLLITRMCSELSERII